MRVRAFCFAFLLLLGCADTFVIKLLSMHLESLPDLPQTNDLMAVFPKIFLPQNLILVAAYLLNLSLIAQEEVFFLSLSHTHTHSLFSFSSLSTQNHFDPNSDFHG